mgnify:CR=1 FL=1
MSARVAVIGAGMGGLTSAALLAACGHDVTVLEKVDFVMRRGVVHKLGGKRQAFPPE